MVTDEPRLIHTYPRNTRTRKRQTPYGLFGIAKKGTPTKNSVSTAMLSSERHIMFYFIQKYTQKKEREEEEEEVEIEDEHTAHNINGSTYTSIRLQKQLFPFSVCMKFLKQWRCRHDKMIDK